MRPGTSSGADGVRIGTRFLAAEKAEEIVNGLIGEAAGCWADGRRAGSVD